LTTERQQLETIQEKFHKEFEAVSNKLILDNASRFNQQSTESLGKLLTPLKETLGEFKASLETTRKETATHSALLKEQVSRIGMEAANLSKALKGDVKVLGNWGENMLDQILEKSGLQRELHYRRQRGAKDVEGDQRFLDVIVDLPDKRNLVIDSKVSLRAYEESVNATDDPAKFAGLDRHIEALRKHFRDLGAKRYQDIHGINTPDFVLMYVPIEAAFFAAIAREPGLFAEAGDHNVVLITNSTLLATLRTVANVWRLADQQKHVLEIADRGGKLYDKFVGFVEDLQAVGDSLGKARKAWEDASTKLHTGSGNLVSQTEKLKQLGAKAAKSLPNALLEKANEETPSSDSTLHLPPE
jgi:DNA recombination protein RmuC